MKMFNPFHHARKASSIAMAIAVTMVGAHAFPRAAMAGGPPPNDLCSGAIVLSGTGPFPLLSPPTDVTNATFTNDPITSCTANDDHGVWYSFTPTVTNNYKISTCQSVATSSTVPDTVLGIFTSPDCVNFTEIGCNDDSCSFQSTTTALLMGGTRYLIYASVFGFGDPVPPPPNNIIQVAIELGDLIFADGFE